MSGPCAAEPCGPWFWALRPASCALGSAPCGPAFMVRALYSVEMIPASYEKGPRSVDLGQVAAPGRKVGAAWQSVFACCGDD